MDHDPERGEVVARADFGGELEQVNEHGRHHLRCGHAILLDRPQRGFGLEPGHHHHRSAQSMTTGRITRSIKVVGLYEN